MNIYIIMIGLSTLCSVSSFFCKSYVRSFTRNPILMRAKKKNMFLADDISKNKSFKKYPQYQPKGENQQKYVHFLQDTDTSLVLGIGPAGCGKTLFACLQAIQDLQNNKINKIILTRPVVPVEEEELGFLPGNLVKKMDPWTRPIFDIFSEFYQQRDIENMIHCGILEISPLAYMRGRTFKNAFIIADEMQNSTPNQMLMLTTRLGEHSKMVITGDLKQSDKSSDNGLLDFMTKLDNYNKIQHDSPMQVKMITMNTCDVQRSPIVMQILDIYNNYTSTPTPIYHSYSISDPTGTNDAALLPKNALPKNKLIYDNNNNNNNNN